MPKIFVADREEGATEVRISGTRRGLAVTESIETTEAGDDAAWVVTHLNSGVKISNGEGMELGEALELMNKLAQEKKWDEMDFDEVWRWALKDSGDGRQKPMEDEPI